MAVPVSGSRVSAGDFQPDETVAVPEVIEPEQQDSNQDQEQNKRQKNRQKNNKQKKPQDKVEQLITESRQVGEVGSQRAASWVMSGALPAPSREASREPSQALVLGIHLEHFGTENSSQPKIRGCGELTRHCSGKTRR